MRKCPNCKNKVSKGMNFCDQCGTVLQKNKRIFLWNETKIRICTGNTEFRINYVIR